MKKICLILIACIVLFSSCISTVTVPYSDAGIITALERKDYKILGEVTLNSKAHNVLGFVTWGGKGYEDLLSLAKEIYPECDAVINIYQDKGSNIYLGVYNELNTVLIGTAIDIIE